MGEEAGSTLHSAGVVFDAHAELVAPLSGAADRGEADSPLVWGRSCRMDHVSVVLSGAFAGWLCLRPYARDVSLTASASPGTHPRASGFAGDFTYSAAGVLARARAGRSYLAYCHAPGRDGGCALFFAGRHGTTHAGLVRAGGT